MCAILLGEIKTPDISFICDNLGLDHERPRAQMIAELQSEVDRGHDYVIDEILKEIKVDDLRAVLIKLNANDIGTRDTLVKRIRAEMTPFSDVPSASSKYGAVKKESGYDQQSSEPVSKAHQLNSIKIQGKQAVNALDVQKLVESFGSIERFFMADRSLTAYVTYADTRNAARAQEKLNNAYFPEDSSNKLEVVLMSHQNLKDEIDHIGNVQPQVEDPFRSPIVPPTNPRSIIRSRRSSDTGSSSRDLRTTVSVQMTHPKDVHRIRSDFEYFGSLVEFSINTHHQIAFGTYEDAQDAIAAYESLATRLRGRDTDLPPVRVELYTTLDGIQAMEALKEQEEESPKEHSRSSKHTLDYRQYSRERPKSHAPSHGNSPSSHRTSRKEEKRAVGSSGTNGHGRIVKMENSAGSPDASDSLKITGFIGSVKHEDVRKMLEEYGPVDSLWMTRLRKVAFVTYRLADSAMLALSSLDKLKWPEDIGKRLDPTLLTRRVAEASKREYQEQEQNLGGPKVPYEKIKPRLDREKELKFQARRALDLNARLINKQRSAEAQEKNESRPPSVSSRHSDRPTEYNRLMQTPVTRTALVDSQVGNVDISLENLMESLIDGLPKEHMVNFIKQFCKVDPTDFSRWQCCHHLMTVFKTALQKLVSELQSGPLYQSPVSGEVDLASDHWNSDRKRGLEHDFDDDTYSKRSKQHGGDRTPLKDVIVASDILHVKNLDPSVPHETMRLEFAEYGTLCNFWMHPSKRECFVQYKDVHKACKVYQDLNDTYYLDHETGEETHFKFSITYMQNDEVQAYVREAERQERERKLEEEKQKRIRRQEMEEEAIRQRQLEEQRRRDKEAQEERMRLRRVEQEAREMEQTRRNIEEQVEKLKRNHEEAKIKAEELDRLRAESRERSLDSRYADIETSRSYSDYPPTKRLARHIDCKSIFVSQFVRPLNSESANILFGAFEDFKMDKSRTRVFALYNTYEEAYRAQEALHNRQIQDDPHVYLKAVFMNPDEAKREIERIDAENEARLEAEAKAQMPVSPVKDEPTVFSKSDTHMQGPVHVLIENITRPFRERQIKSELQRFGNIVGYRINKGKEHGCVLAELSNTESAQKIQSTFDNARISGTYAIVTVKLLDAQQVLEFEQHTVLDDA